MSEQDNTTERINSIKKEIKKLEDSLDILEDEKRTLETAYVEVFVRNPDEYKRHFWSKFSTREDAHKQIMEWGKHAWGAEFSFHNGRYTHPNVKIGSETIVFIQPRRADNSIIL